VALPLLGMAIGGGIGGLVNWLANRDEEREAADVMATVMGGSDAPELSGQEGPPVPLPLQEERGTALITPAQAALAESIADPRERRDYLLEVSAPRIEENRQFRENQRALARQNEMLQPEMRVNAQADALARGDASFLTLDQDAGIVVPVAVTGSDQWVGAVDVLTGSAGGLDSVLQMEQRLAQLQEENAGTLQFIDSGDPRIAQLESQAAGLILQLRDAFSTGQLDEGTERLFAAMGLNLGRTNLENVGDFIRLLQADPAAQRSRLQELATRLSDRLQGSLYETRFYQGIDPTTVEQAGRALQLYDQVAAAGMPEGGTTAYRELIQSGGLGDLLGLGLSLIPGTTDEQIQGIVESLGATQSGPGAPVPRGRNRRRRNPVNAGQVGQFTLPTLANPENPRGRNRAP